MSSSSASKLNPDLAEKFARLALGHVRRPYPYKLDQVLADMAVREKDSFQKLAELVKSKVA